MAIHGTTSVTGTPSSGRAAALYAMIHEARQLARAEARNGVVPASAPRTQNLPVQEPDGVQVTAPVAAAETASAAGSQSAPAPDLQARPYSIVPISKSTQGLWSWLQYQVSRW